MARLHESGVRTVVVSSSSRCAEVLALAGLDELVATVVDEGDAERGSLRGAPDPSLLMHAAEVLGVHPARAAVVDDTTAGVEAACRGGVGFVVGLTRRAGRSARLRAHGADTVVRDLKALMPDDDVAACRWWPRDTREVGNAAWLLDYVGVDPRAEGTRETLCTLSNGYLATRGAAPETAADVGHYPGTYVAGVYNRLRSRVHGHAHEDESLVNLPNWLSLQWRPAGGRWLGPDSPAACDYRQSLDLRAGVLHRRYRVVDARGRATTVVHRRLVSMVAPHLGAMETVFIAENWSGTLQMRAGIDGRVRNAQVPEYAPLSGRHLRPTGQGRHAGGVWLRTRTTQSRVEVGVATRTRVFIGGGRGSARRQVRLLPACAREEFAIPVERGIPVRVETVAALSTSRDRTISEPVRAAREEVAHADGFGELLNVHVDASRQLWERKHVHLAVKWGRAGTLLALHTFHLLQTASSHLRELDVSVGARGLHGEGYRGHVFWDELFVHRVLVLHQPEVSRALLLYRYRRLPQARRAARNAGYCGAMFPWQSGSDGREETPSELFNARSGTWMPDRSAHQRHVGLAIAYSVWQYYQATGDLDFLLRYGAELMLDLARFFADLARRDPDTGRYVLTGVMGPDEFHDGYPDGDSGGVANNAYTNIMTVWLLRRALGLAGLLRGHHCAELLDRLGISEQQLQRFADISTRMYVPFHGQQIISQFDGYERLAEFDFDGYAARYGNIGRLDLILAAEGDTSNRYQVGKHADVLMLLYLLSAEDLRNLLARLGYDWPEQALLRTVNYYFPRVSHGSALSRVVHSWVHARTDRAHSWSCFTEALSVDVADTQGGTTREGIHLGAMAGTLDLAECCYLGLETRDDALWLNPRLPREITRLHPMLAYRGHWLHVLATQTELTISASPCEVEPVAIRAGDRLFRLAAGDTMTVPVKGAEGVTAAATNAVPRPHPSGTYDAG